MFARKTWVEILKPAGPKPCPIARLDSFCMRSFTGHSPFDETLPVAEGGVEAGFRVGLEALRVDVEGWLTRKFGAGRRSGGGWRNGRPQSPHGESTHPHHIKAA